MRSRLPASTRQEASRSDAVRRPYQKCVRNVSARLQVNKLQSADLQALYANPLTDSNRRPPPYHGGLGASRAYMRGHSRARLSCKLASSVCRACPRVTERARADVPVWYPRGVACLPKWTPGSKTRVGAAAPAGVRARLLSARRNRRRRLRDHRRAAHARWRARATTRGRDGSAAR
jgi:hypothetical protein